MRKICYSVAMSLDGYIAGPGGEYDWIPHEPEIDWTGFMARFDTMLVGRKTYEVAQAQGGGPSTGMRTFVFSRTLRPEDHPDVTVVAEDAAGAVAGLKAEEGNEIWLMGGGVLAASLLDAGLVDAVEVGLVPVLLGGGLPFLPGLSRRVRLALRERQEYSTSGIVHLSYEVARDAPGRRRRSR